MLIVLLQLNFRGVNSVDEIFILTIGLEDSAALTSLNEREEISRNLLMESLENFEKRVDEMHKCIAESSVPLRGITLRTMESLAF